MNPGDTYKTSRGELTVVEYEGMGTYLMKNQRGQYFRVSGLPLLAAQQRALSDQKASHLGA